MNEVSPIGRWLAGLIAMGGLVGCQRPLSDAECNMLLERYTEKVIDQSRPSATPGERARLVGEAKSQAVLDPEFEDCAVRVNRRQYDCAMGAANADEMERCLL